MPSSSKREDRTDHLGNVYSSKIEMCDTYRISRTAYDRRINLGWDKEKALTTPMELRGKDESPEARTDHTGMRFTSVQRMCEAWNVGYNLYKQRIQRGHTKEEALTGKGIPNAPQRCTDHLGNQFGSLKEMCDYWGCTREAYAYRTKKGYNLEQTLTGEGIVPESTGTKCTDHLGNEFNSIKEMCKHWGISYKLYRERHNKYGHSVEESLTGKNIKHGSERNWDLDEAYDMSYLYKSWKD